MRLRARSGRSSTSITSRAGPSGRRTAPGGRGSSRASTVPSRPRTCIERRRPGNLSGMSDDVKHQPGQGRFVISLDNGEEVLLEYREQGATVDFYHTFVPQAARGKGLAERVV